MESRRDKWAVFTFIYSMSCETVTKYMDEAQVCVSSIQTNTSKLSNLCMFKLEGANMYFITCPVHKYLKLC